MFGQAVKRFGIQEDKSRGKGSERIFVGKVGDEIIKYPTKCHREGDTEPVGVIRAIRRASSGVGRIKALMAKLPRKMLPRPPGVPCNQFNLGNNEHAR